MLEKDAPETQLNLCLCMCLLHLLLHEKHGAMNRGSNKTRRMTPALVRRRHSESASVSCKEFAGIVSREDLNGFAQSDHRFSSDL